MSTNVLSLLQALTPENMADEIINKWVRLKLARNSWESEMLEIRNFAFATSTKTTEVNANQYNNSTTIPKLSQIAMNLKANYSAHLFGNPDWVQFEAFDNDAASIESKEIVEAYARTKVKRKGYEKVFDRCLDDWIYTGVTFAQQRYVTEMGVDKSDNPIVVYQGPVLERIAPDDIVFDVTATDFKSAVKIIRKVYTLGDIARLVADDAQTGFTEAMLNNIRETKLLVRSSGMIKPPEGVDWKGQALTKDGFGDMLEYVSGDLVEVHEFYGDMYSVETGEFLPNHKITVVDRRMVIEKKPNGNLNGSQLIYMSGWEARPENLMAMSPLARLVGMQFKLDKLENMRADIFDRIANPDVVEVGDVEFYGVRGAPGGRYVVDENGDVRYLRPDTTILNADFQINSTMLIMEEMAGSPRNATGFRTPGEKTKFEVQVLDNGGNRIFREKTKNFEKEFVEEVLNDMIMLGRDNIGETDMVSTQGTEFDIQKFLSVNAEDLNISGKLRARGSSLFAEKANALQNLTTLLNNPYLLGLIQQHTSRIALYKAVEDLAELKTFNLFLPNIGVQEDQATAKIANQAQKGTEVNQAIDAEEPEDELDEGEPLT